MFLPECLDFNLQSMSDSKKPSKNVEIMDTWDRSLLQREEAIERRVQTWISESVGFQTLFTHFLHKQRIKVTSRRGLAEKKTRWCFFGWQPRWLSCLSPAWNLKGGPASISRRFFSTFVAKASKGFAECCHFFPVWIGGFYTVGLVSLEVMVSKNVPIAAGGFDRCWTKCSIFISHGAV